MLAFSSPVMVDVEGEREKVLARGPRCVSLSSDRIRVSKLDSQGINGIMSTLGPSIDLLISPEARPRGAEHATDRLQAMKRRPTYSSLISKTY